MTTAADFEPELVDALNLLIEDERASVEMEVALASGATEYAERESLTRMGVEDIHTCETMRAEMERAGLPVTPQINGVVFEVLGAERYDDRLHAFAHHQRIVAERANDLLESNLDGALRDALEAIIATHERHITWASERADVFAASRLLEFGPRPQVPLAEEPPVTAAEPLAAPEATPPLLEIPVPSTLMDLPQEALIEEPPISEAPTTQEMTRPETAETVEPPSAAPAKRARSATPRKPAARKPAASKPAASKPAARTSAKDKPVTRKPASRKKPSLPEE